MKSGHLCQCSGAKRLPCSLSVVSHTKTNATCFPVHVELTTSKPTKQTLRNREDQRLPERTGWDGGGWRGHSRMLCQGSLGRPFPCVSSGLCAPGQEGQVQEWVRPPSQLALRCFRDCTGAISSPLSTPRGRPGPLNRPLPVTHIGTLAHSHLRERGLKGLHSCEALRDPAERAWPDTSCKDTRHGIRPPNPRPSASERPQQPMG